jgi:NTE family protein
MNFIGKPINTAGSQQIAVAGQMAWRLVDAGRAERHAIVLEKNVRDNVPWVLQQSWIDGMNGKFGLEHSPGYLFMDALMYFTSPSLYNPLNNPIKSVLEEIVDFDRLRRQPMIKLFLCATNVRTGKVKVFESEEIGPNQVLASTCLPC